ncbi:methylated-DNA--[protein]-cysteine S-methyltransferase [Thalassotalea maritima]|uniref:methylated-DNA--[protein]-cysteine S-methyltransferase n=1 Tax=Thalassotalea maritima TaxID=3242416 RepID=UPI003526EDDB
MIHYQIITTPLGDLAVVADEHGICQVAFQQGKAAITITSQMQPDSASAPAHLQQAITQLNEYFQGTRQTFELPLSQPGTPFQQRVWHALTHIKYGKTSSYAGLAEEINNPRAVRAVGTANGANKIAIIVPCHRVIGKDKTLTGYAGGMALKAKLLMHEGAYFKP